MTSKSTQLVDQLGRVHTNLRLSVTDRCNIRCFYCMPDENVRFKPRHELLSFEEITRLAGSLQEGVDLLAHRLVAQAGPFEVGCAFEGYRQLQRGVEDLDLFAFGLAHNGLSGGCSVFADCLYLAMRRSPGIKDRGS